MDILGPMSWPVEPCRGGNLSCTKLKEGILGEINLTQLPREPSTTESAPLHKGTIECALHIPKRSASSPESINDSAPHTPKLPERALGRRSGPSAHRGTRLDWPWLRPENIKILLLAREARQQDFEGLLWGQWIWRPWPISYQAHGPYRGRRNVRERTKKVYTVRMYCQGQPCPRQIEIAGGESAMSPRAIA